MFARITTTNHSPYRLDEAIEIARQKILPAAKQQKGFKGYLMLVDRSTGSSLTITLWEDETDRDLTGEDSQYYRDALSQVVPLLSGQPSIDDFEVVVQA